MSQDFNEIQYLHVASKASNHKWNIFLESMESILVVAIQYVSVSPVNMTSTGQQWHTIDFIALRLTHFYWRLVTYELLNKFICLVDFKEHNINKTQT